jgi:signal transduction histidine kinase/DNA-binding response OmpR family regulator/HAMP domain-containing protein
MAVQLALITLVASMAAALLAWILASRLVAPIVGVARAAVSIQGGRMEARTGLGGGSDEVGRLASAVDSMAGALEEEMAVKEGVSALLAAAAYAQDPASLARAILVEAQRLTDCDMCAFFVIERASRDRLVPLASVGVSTELLDSFDASRFEGEFGRALATREITRITDIPADTAFHFKTAAGSLAPREICTVPLVVGNAVEAILSLAAVRGCRGRGLESLARSRQALAEAFERVRLAERHALLSRSLAASNAELSAMNQELEVQADELRQSADELLEQKEELEARRQQVEEADRLKSEFLSNMSHELRTPLNSILTLSQLLLQRDTPSSPEDAEHLRIIERSGRHLLLLINDILDLSKIEAGRMDLDLTEVAPLEVARLALDTVRATALEKGLEIAVSGSDAIPRVESDEQRLKQILLNLLSNAVKFTDRGRVDVRLSAAGEAVAIAVQDTGIGIPPDQLEHIFEEFRQVDGSITRRYGGSGLGLAISRKLAGLLGVTLTVRSVPGEGSCFTLTVPFRWTGAGASAPSARREPAPARAPAEAPSPARILVMEDQEVVARQIHDALRDAGHVVEVALGGAEAIEKAAAAPPDLVVLDLMMPGVDGLSVLARLRRMKETADVPIIILTAKELTRREREIIGRNEIAELITKGSVDRAELLRRIGAQLTPAEPGAVAPALSVAPAATDPAAVPADPLADLALVVEDNPDNVAALGAFLDRIGCPFVVARDGESALALARARRPGLVLLDIQLPGMSGLDVARALRADAAMRHARLVALTAKAMPGDREAALEAGCDEHLAKPLDLQRLEALVRSWRARP